jgi:(p)ppGpp synthase/HD superfamily hydrolase
MAKKKTATPREGQRVRTRIKHTFTEQEKDDKVKEMTRTMREVELKQEQLKSANATAKAEIRFLLAGVTDLRNQLEDGGQPIEVDAVKVVDRKEGTKSLYRFCPGQPGHDEFLSKSNLTEDEYQELPLMAEEPAKPDDDLPHPEE